MFEGLNKLINEYNGSTIDPKDQYKLPLDFGPFEKLLEEEKEGREVKYGKNNNTNM